MLPISTIVHPTDFSPQSESAFQVACALARDYGARLVLVHVRQSSVMVFGEFGALPATPEEDKDLLQEKLAELRPADKNARVERFLAEGDPAQEIIRLAREKKADVIVMGTHGRTGLGRLLMGSVAELVVRRAPCLVLTVKAPVPIPVMAAEMEATPAAV